MPLSCSATVRALCWGALLLVHARCGKFELSPYSTDTGDLPTGLNAANAAALAATEATADDTVSFLFMGDCQRFYEEVDAMVAKANALPGLDFAIMAGDLTDFGLLQEYRWVIEHLAPLHVPVFCALGNHDVQGRGEELFRMLYGPPDFVVRYKGYRFIFHDTNGREHGNDGTAPDLAWLQQAFAAAGQERVFTVSHVPPMNGDFDPALVGPYTALQAAQPTLLASLHAHQGSFYDGVPYGDGVRYIVCNALNVPDLLWVRVVGDSLFLQHVPL